MARQIQTQQTAQAAVDPYAAACRILPSLRPTEPDDGCTGLVGEVAEADRAGVVAALTEAGYEVSDSTDDDGQRWVWVIAPTPEPAVRGMVVYQLSEAGQRVALAAGHDGRREQRVDRDIPVRLLEHCQIAEDGSRLSSAPLDRRTDDR